MRAFLVGMSVGLLLLPGHGTASAAPTLNPGSITGNAHEQEVVANAAAQTLASTAKGVAIAIVKPGLGPDLSTTTTYYYGEADAATHRLVGPNTQFEIASETKTFTGALLAQALALGLVHIDDPVSNWVPPGTTVPSLGGQVITLRDLVTHRSGLTDDPWNLTGPDAKAHYDAEKLWTGVNGANLEFTPGEGWLYSDFAFGLLGTVLANIFMPNQAQPPFAQVVAQNLTGPLGMGSTVVELPTPNRAVGYDANGPAPYWNNTAALAGGGGLISTADDMATWVRTTLGIGLNPLARLLPTELDYLAPGKTAFTMGMAWQLFPHADGFPLPYAWKNGGSTGFSSATFLVPEKNWAVTILANGGDDEAASVAGLDIMRALARESFIPGTGSSFGS